MDDRADAAHAGRNYDSAAAGNGWSAADHRPDVSSIQSPPDPGHASPAARRLAEHLHAGCTRRSHGDVGTAGRAPRRWGRRLLHPGPALAGLPVVPSWSSIVTTEPTRVDPPCTTGVDRRCVAVRGPVTDRRPLQTTTPGIEAGGGGYLREPQLCRRRHASRHDGRLRDARTTCAVSRERGVPGTVAPVLICPAAQPAPGAFGAAHWARSSRWGLHVARRTLRASARIARPGSRRRAWRCSVEHTLASSAAAPNWRFHVKRPVPARIPRIHQQRGPARAGSFRGSWPPH